jgi:hypothetical protein
MENLAEQLMHELTAPRAWFFLLLLPLFLLLVIRYSYNALQFGKRQQPDEHRLPPSPPWRLPLLGHLHLIGSLPHVSLRSLSTKHGVDLMLLHLGAMPVLVVSSPGAAEAVLRTHDHVFASRPNSVAAEVILYGSSDIGFAPYGDTWRKARMLVTTHLLTMRRVQLFRHSREEEVSMVMAQVLEAAAVGMAVDLGKVMSSFLNDLICRSVMGKSSCGEGRSKRLQQLVADTSPLLGSFSVEEFFPFLARFGVLCKMVRIKRLKKRWDELLDRLIDEHESKYKPPMAEAAPQNDLKDEDDNFIQILLSVREAYNLTRDKMKAILLVSSYGSYAYYYERTILRHEIHMERKFTHCHFITYVKIYRVNHRGVSDMHAGRVSRRNRYGSCGTRIHFR